MSPLGRRALLMTLALPAASASADAVQRGRALVFPRDHGAHPDASIEWWYATGWLGGETAPSHGFQVTFFRSRTGLAQALPGRFAPRQMLFAHAALTDLKARRHHHAERIVRWDGRSASATAAASQADADVRIERWHWQRGDGPPAAWRAGGDGPLTFDITLTATQPLLLQGDRGFSRKGPDEANASHYYSAPQLAADARFALDGREVRGRGRAWLDHEWSDSLLHEQAVGWDWIGINLADGGALMAFQLRRADGTVSWAGGSWRSAAGATQVFAPDAVRFTPVGRQWTSAATRARYPVQWQIECPAGRFEVNALLDAQEVDARATTGTLYWEGLAELLDGARRRIGLGYLELTGYGQRLRLG